MASFPRDHSGRHAHGVQSACSRMLEKTLDRPVTVEVISSSLGIATLLPGGTAFGQLGFPADALYKAPWLAWFGGAYGAVGFALAAIRSASAIGGHVHRLTSARSYQCSSIILAGSVSPSTRRQGSDPFSGVP